MGDKGALLHVHRWRLSLCWFRVRGLSAGMPEVFASGHAVASDWQEAVRSVAAQLGDLDDDDIGFVYVTDHVAGHLHDVVSFLAAATGLDQWCGTVGIGVCSNPVESFDEPAIVALACRLPGVRAHVFRSVGEAVERWQHTDPGDTAGFGIVHGDPRDADVLNGLTRLARETGSFLVGGLASSRSRSPTHAGGGAGDGLSGVLLSGAQVATALTQGCSLLDGSHEITSADGKAVLELDGRPVFDVLGERFTGARASQRPIDPASLHVALPIAGSDAGAFVVRNIVGIDPHQRAMLLGDDVTRGDVLMFCVRDNEAAEADLRRMLHSLKSRVPRPLGGLYFSCLARGPHMFGAVNREMEIVRDVLGDVPVAGFFSNGEISLDRLYAYTGVLTLFRGD